MRRHLQYFPASLAQPFTAPTTVGWSRWGSFHSEFTARLVEWDKQNCWASFSLAPSLSQSWSIGKGLQGWLQMLSGSAAEELGAQQWHAEILEIVPLNLTNLTNAISCYKSNPARHQGWQQLMLAFLFLHWLHSVYLSVILRTMRIHSGLWRVWYLEASVLKKYEKYPSHSRGDVLCQTGIQNYIKIKKKTVSSLHQVISSWWFLTHISHWFIHLHRAQLELVHWFPPCRFKTGIKVHVSKPFLHGDTMVNINPSSSVNFAHKDPRHRSKTATLPSAVWI